MEQLSNWLNQIHLLSRPIHYGRMVWAQFCTKDTIGANIQQTLQMPLVHGGFVQAGLCHQAHGVLVTVDVERSFSQYKYVLSDRRTRLTDEKIEPKSGKHRGCPCFRPLLELASPLLIKFFYSPIVSSSFIISNCSEFNCFKWQANLLLLPPTIYLAIEKRQQFVSICNYATETGLRIHVYLLEHATAGSTSNLTNTHFNVWKMWIVLCKCWKPTCSYGQLP